VGTRRGKHEERDEREGRTDPDDPTVIQDVFFRLGGVGPASVTTSLVVNSDNVIIDNIWAWRADPRNRRGLEHEHR
jgi:hypothetical protein